MSINRLYIETSNTVYLDVICLLNVIDCVVYLVELAVAAAFHSYLHVALYVGVEEKGSTNLITLQYHAKACKNFTHKL